MLKYPSMVLCSSVEVSEWVCEVRDFVVVHAAWFGAVVESSGCDLSSHHHPLASSLAVCSCRIAELDIAQVACEMPSVVDYILEHPDTCIVVVQNRDQFDTV